MTRQPKGAFHPGGIPLVEFLQPEGVTHAELLSRSEAKQLVRGPDDFCEIVLDVGRVPRRVWRLLGS